MGPLPLPRPPLVDPATGIRLRPWGESPADAAALFAAWADPAVAETSSVPVDRSLDAAAHWIAGEAARRARGLALDLVISPVDAADPEGVGRLVDSSVWGEVGLTRFDERGRVEIGFWLAPEARHRGRAAAATRLVAGWALAPSGLARSLVWARTQAENEEAQAVLRRSGFGRAGEAGGSIVWTRRAASVTVRP